MPKDGSHVVLFSKDNKKVFLVWRTDYPVWDVTGGGIEEGEDPKYAAIREAKEETNFEIEISDLLFQQYSVDELGNHTKNKYLYKGDVISGEYKPEYEGNIGKWFATNKLPLSMSKSARSKIFNAIKYQPNSGIKLQYEKEKISNNLHILLLHPIFTIKNLKKILKMLTKSQ